MHLVVIELGLSSALSVPNPMLGTLGTQTTSGRIVRHRIETHDRARVVDIDFHDVRDPINAEDSAERFG